MNSWNISGYLGQDPTMRALPNGDPVLNLHVAVPNPVKRGNEWKDEPIWVDVTVFGNRCQWLHDNLRTGSLIEASGRMSLRQYDGNDGKRHTRVELVAKECNALSNFGDKAEHRQQSGREAAQQRGGMRTHGTRPGTGAYPYDPNDDIAF